MRVWISIFLFFFAFSAEAQQTAPQPTPSVPDRSEPGKAETTPKNEQGQPKQAEPQKQPIIINVLPTPKTKEDAEDEKRERDEKREIDRKTVDLTDKLARFTAWLFYATFALVVCTGGLVYFGRRQAQDMKSSLDIAKESANAAKEAAMIARQSLMETQRAMIAFKEVQFLNLVENNIIVGFIFKANWENVGQTQAMNCSLITAWATEVDPNRQAIAFNIELKGPEATIQRGVGFSGSWIRISRPEMIGFAEGPARLFFLFIAEYRDIFGSDFREEICIMLAINGNIDGPEQGKFGFLAHGPYVVETGSNSRDAQQNTETNETNETAQGGHLRPPVAFAP